MEENENNNTEHTQPTTPTNNKNISEWQTDNLTNNETNCASTSSGVELTQTTSNDEQDNLNKKRRTQHTTPPGEKTMSPKINPEEKRLKVTNTQAQFDESEMMNLTDRESDVEGDVTLTSDTTPENETWDDESRLALKQSLEQKVFDFDTFINENIINRIEKVKTLRTPTTKLALKNEIGNLFAQSLKLKRKLREFTTMWKSLPESGLWNIKPEKNDISTQTISDKKLQEEVAALEIQTSLAKTNQISEKIEIIRETWPERAFKKVKISKNGFTSNKPFRVLIVRENSSADDGLLHQLSLQFPQINKIKDLKPGETAITANSSVGSWTTSSNSKENSICDKLTLIIGKVSKDESAEGMYNITNKTLQLAHKETMPNNTFQRTRDTVTVCFPREYNPDTARKIIEACCPDDMQIEFCRKTSPQPKHQRPSHTSNTNKSVVIVGAGTDSGRSYAETLSELRSKVDPKNHGIVINKVGKTTKGDIKLYLRETQLGSKTAFLNDLKQNTASVVREAISKAKLIVKDLDESLTTKDIALALKKNTLIEKPDELVVEEIRTSKFGTRSAAVHVSRSDCSRLTQSRRIQIGWTLCRIEEWISLPSCQNCQKIGHIAKDCKESKVNDTRCHKCSEVGHSTKDCQAQTTKCYTCQADGHASNSMGCPVYRQKIQQLRESKNRVRQTNTIHDQKSVYTCQNTNITPESSTVDHTGCNTEEHEWCTVTRRSQKKHA